MGSGGNAGTFKPDDETYLAGKVFLLFWDQPDFCLDTNRRKVCPSGNVRSLIDAVARAGFFTGNASKEPCPSCRIGQTYRINQTVL